jgi:hypothetical protein
MPDFKSCLYEDRSKIYFNKKWHDLLRGYNVEDNVRMSNLNVLRDE